MRTRNKTELIMVLAKNAKIVFSESNILYCQPKTNILILEGKKMVTFFRRT